jgi:glycosyltransferase involved in cell wall biosynthesis
VFGYPLAPDTSAASELALEEAMYGAIVLAPAAVRRHIIDGETGFVARSGDEHVRAIAYLNDHPEQRTRIGNAAHDFAVRMLSPSAIAGR